ncbi:5'-nucleotidase domain-containing protein 1 [Galendromus occidentalis]|uniref:5'-nucleotidase domain-containing protein 1 n=1 Tax=Galendromus occidentalis TaxID=34638 RepID=A0AAJ6QPA4_9ACAR|nr:5'-nucleotidase domain-containing protein 1 [Galendromus occidentalis]
MVNRFFKNDLVRAEEICGKSLADDPYAKSPYFHFTDWPVVAFDIDHTLARYRLDNLHKLCYDLVVKFLVDKGYYSKETFRPFGELDLSYAQRGIYFYKRKGVFLKLDEEGNIVLAYSGTTLMDLNEALYKYAGSKELIAMKYDPFFREEGADRNEEPVHCFDDFFTTGTIYLLMELVQKCIDEKDPDFELPFKRIMEAYNFLFAKEDFARGEGGFFSALKENPSEYLYTLSSDFLQWLKTLKESKLALLIITNSKADFANFVLGFVIGEDWRDYFDAVITSAKKPHFFTLTVRNFYWLDGFEQGEVVKPGEYAKGREFCHGGFFNLKYIIKAACGHMTPRMLFVGDNLVGDIYACHETMVCGVIGVVEEFGSERSSAWGPMLGTKSEPSFWRRKLEQWTTGIVSSVETLTRYKPDERIIYSSPEFHVFTYRYFKSDLPTRREKVPLVSASKRQIAL